jgi:hypothetical protein
MRSNSYYSKRINSATTTQVKVGNSRLVRIVVTAPVDTKKITIIDGDGTTNTTLGVVTMSGAIPFHLDLDIRMTQGIRITTDGIADLIVVYE